MPSEMYELSEDKCGSRTSLTQGRSKENGCRCSLPMAFLLLLLAVLLSVGVGLIVHFAGSAGRQVVCQCQAGQGVSAAEQQRQCQELASTGNNLICSACTGSAMTSTPMTTGSTPSPTTAPKVDVRLPLALDPVFYDVELRPDLYGPDPKAFFFDGSVKIRLMALKAFRNITLHIKDLNVTDVTLAPVGSMTSSGPRILRHSEDKVREFLVIELDSPLTVDDVYDVSMNFRGPLTDDLHGLYLSEYKRGNETVYVAATQFQPTDARAAFPCLDEPAIKSHFNITLVRKSSRRSLSNMPIVRQEPRGDGWIADVYQTSPKMPTYLLAFIICDFDFTNATTTRGVTYRAWATPEAVQQTVYALDVGVKILTYFEDYFNITFPLPKQDMIAIPDFAAGAMENWGLITYRETAMLYQPGVSSEGNKQRVAVVVSHELAHQWFGDLVTPSWWDDLWLNEGFASFVEYMGVDHVHPDWKMFEQFVVSDLQDVFNFDGLISSHPVYVPVSHPDEINEIFDRISYAKGASIIRMMRFFLGEETFRKGLTNYLRSRAYGAAFHDDLWYALGNQSRVEGKNLNVKRIMDTWTLQMNYPVVNVAWVGQGQVRLTQQRFLIDPTASDPGKYTSPFGYKWNIPITLTHSGERNFTQTDASIQWMDRTSSQPEVKTWSGLPSRDSNSSWILANVLQYGYYRVNYERQNWMALIHQLKTNHTVIPAINRAQIINDAWKLATAGMLDMRVALGTVEYLQLELDYVPRVAADRELLFVKKMLSRTGLYGSFQNFMKSKIQRPYDIIGFNNTDATHMESYVRSTVVGTACEYGLKQCVDNATQLFAQWMANPSVNPVDPGLKYTVYCQAVAQGGVEEFDFAYSQYQSSNVAAEQSRLLQSMACASTPWIISRYLDWTLDTTKIRKQDALSTIGNIARSPVGRGLAWDFFRTRWADIRRDYGASFFAFTSVIGGLTEAFNTQFELEQLQSFLDTHKDTGSGQRAFEQALEKTRANIKWMDNHFETIKSWLEGQGF